MARWFRWWLGLTAAGVVFLGLGGALTAADEPGPDTAAEQKPLDKTVYDTLRIVHNRGADLYNQGDAAGCYRMFQGALTTIQPLLGDHPELQKTIQNGLTSADAQPSIARRAFALHEVIEDVRGKLRQGGKKPEEMKPEEVKPDVTKPEDKKPVAPTKPEMKPEDKKPEEPKPDVTKPEDKKPEEPKPDVTKPEDKKPEEKKPEEAKPDVPKPEEKKPDDKKPEEPKLDLPKPEVPKGDIPKPDILKPEGDKPDTTKPADK